MKLQFEKGSIIITTWILSVSIIVTQYDAIFEKWTMYILQQIRETST